MKNKCFDIGTIQAFIDGELGSDLSEKVIKHIALCDGCANLLAETEEESTFAFSVIDDELNCLVPTERLRTKVFDSIRQIERSEKVSWWQELAGSLGLSNGFGFGNRGLVAFASIFLFVSMLAIGVKLYNPLPDQSSVARIDVARVGQAEIPDQPTVSNNVEEVPVETTRIQTNDSDIVITERAINRRSHKAPQFTVQKAIQTVENKSPRPPKAVDQGNNRQVSPALAEEAGYLQTIATLNKSVDQNKDYTLRPTERIAFERDLAVVNDAIKKMKMEVRKNPNNRAARDVLRSSYKSKIDLLNSVAEKSELMASIQ
jgi:hypothetical protein